jgi:hypothetical protein
MKRNILVKLLVLMVLVSSVTGCYVEHRHYDPYDRRYRHHRHYDRRYDRDGHYWRY